MLFVATVGSLIFEKDSQLLVRNSFRGKPWKKSYAAGHRTMFFLSFFLPSFRSFFQSAKKTARVFSNSRRPKRFDLKCVNSARQAEAQSIRATRINACPTDFRFAKNFRATPFRLCLDSRSTSSWIDFGEREKVIKSRVG